jgi:hypothetical protein
MEKSSLLQRINPLNWNPVVLLIAALVFEIAFEVLWRMLAEWGVIRSQGLFVFVLYMVQVLSKSVFFIIILKYRSYEKRYVLYAVFSILALFFFGLLYYNYLLYDRRSLAIDLNFVLAAAGFFMAIYISVDPTVRGFVKPILVIHSLLLVLYFTFFRVVWNTLIIEVYARYAEEYNNVALILLIGVYHIVYLLWTLPQIAFIRKIDYI